MRTCQRAVLSVAIAVFTLASTWAGGSDDAAKKELKLFQGSWKAIAVRNANGNPMPDNEVEQTRMTVEGKRFTLKTKDLTLKGTFTINPSETPKSIDVTLINDNGQETKLLGIYEIKGDTRKSCFALPQQDRPKQFMTQSGYVTFEWKRN